MVDEGQAAVISASPPKPATARAIAERLSSTGATMIDGGIVGPPAHTPGTTRLYLSGDGAGEVAALWRDSRLDARVIDGGPGAASALKMAYATWTKVSSAMLLAVRALARAEGVEATLLAEWAISQPGTADRSEATARGTAPKAWRFDGENPNPYVQEHRDLIASIAGDRPRLLASRHFWKQVRRSSRDCLRRAA